MSVQKLDRNIFQRLFGLCATRKPSRQEAWGASEGKITLDLKAVPELNSKGSAVRIDGKGIKVPVLVVHGNDREYRAFQNRCTHGKRALDPVPGTNTIQCCSVGTSTFSYDGTLIEGPAKGPLTVYRVDQAGETLTITLK